MVNTVVARLLWLLLVLPLSASAASVDSKRDELKQLQGRIGALEKDLSQSEASKADAANELREIQASMAEANRKLGALGDKRDAVQAQLTALTRQLQQLSAQAELQQQQLSGLLYQQFTQGGNDALRLLLSGEDPNQSARDRYFFTLLSRQKAQLLDDIRDAAKEKKRLAEAARGKNDELAGIEKEQEAERAILLAKQKRSQVLLAKISSRIQSQKKQIDTLKANEKRLGSLIDNLVRQAARRKAQAQARAQAKTKSQPRSSGTAVQPSRPGKPVREPDLSQASGAFAALRGKLRLPAQGPVAERFGTPRGEGGVTWKGIVIRAAVGSPVQAVAAGTVVFADWLRGFGNLIIIDHGDDFLSVYGNNQSLQRNAGADVKAGETIAQAGNGGNLNDGGEESGLYFELRHQGRPFDPLRWTSLK